MENMPPNGVRVWALRPKDDWLDSLAPGQLVKFDTSNFEGLRVHKADNTLGTPLFLELLDCPDDRLRCSKVFIPPEEGSEEADCEFYVVSHLLASAAKTSVSSLMASATAFFGDADFPAEVFQYLPLSDAVVAGGFVKIARSLPSPEPSESARVETAPLPLRGSDPMRVGLRQVPQSQYRPEAFNKLPATTNAIFSGSMSTSDLQVGWGEI